MKTTISIFNPQSTLLALATLAIGSIFLFFNHKNIFVETLLRPHGEVAYNLYKYNSLKVNPARMGALAAKEQVTGRRADYYEIDHEKFGPPTTHRNAFDTIGYGVVIGTLWKITDSLNYLDIQILQLLLLAFFMFLFYYIAFMLFKSKRAALFSGIALLSFFPLFYLNAQVFRDIWPFYAAIILLFITIKFLFDGHSWSILISGSMAFALMQWMRSTIFLMIITTSILLFLYAICSKKLKIKRVLQFTLTVLIANVFFYWLPFMTYNKIAYNRYLVGPAGINLIQGLGEFPNKWGYKLSDGWYADYTEKHFGKEAKKLKLTENEKTSFYDDKMRTVFWKSIKEDPLFYLSCIAKRIPRLLFPGLPWFNYQDKKEIYLMYVTGTPVKELIKTVLREPIIAIDFAARHIYIGLFLLFAYLGILLALIRKQYLALLLLFGGIICAGYSVIFAHIDHRYLIPFYGIFAFFVGYFFHEIINVWNRRI